MDSTKQGKKERLLGAARTLRKGMTKEERKLRYEFLRLHACKFYKQRPLAPYIADFYCPQARLVIELDGGQHYTEEGEKSDRERTVYLEKHHAVMVVRFSNREIHQNFRGVCEKIEELLRFRIHRT